MRSRSFSGLPLIGLLAIAYIIAGKLGLMLASLHASASPVWPPAGIALAAMLLFGYRVWPAILVGAFLVNLLILLWSAAGKQRWHEKEVFEVGTLLLLLVLLSGVVFGDWLEISSKNYPITFVCGPVVIWMAFRFTQRETATGILILSAIAVWGTLRVFGPFVQHTENDSLVA